MIDDETFLLASRALRGLDHSSFKSHQLRFRSSRPFVRSSRKEPVHGCSRVSDGCTNCYAERISRQYGHTDHEWTNEFASENVTVRPDKLEEPYGLHEPTRVFVNSMSDLFHSEVPEEFIREVFSVIRNCPEHIFQILTKRPGRAAHLPLEWPANVWMGTSVEDDRVTARIDMLSDVDAHTRFVSFEPLIGPVGEVDLSGIDWAIVGGESEPDDIRREMDHAWAREIYRQCREKDVAFFQTVECATAGTRTATHSQERRVRRLRATEDPGTARSSGDDHSHPKGDR